MNIRFLIDANLPFDVPVWKTERFTHVLHINPEWTDEAIWQYAKEENLIIVTKDKDFIVKQFREGTPPKVIHIKFGNLKFNDFINRILQIWEEVEGLIQKHTIVNIYLTKIEAIK